MDSPFIVALSLSGRPCLVAGNSEQTVARVRALRQAGARVTLISAQLPAELAAEHAAGGLRWLARGFEPSDLDDQWLAVLVEQNAALAKRMAEAASERRVFFCALDQPDSCSFSHVAQARAADLILAISTAGRVPALASRLREELQRLLDEANMPDFFENLAELRRELPSAQRRSVLQRALRTLRISGKLSLPDLMAEDSNER
jgi:precorrin-2 dehydrogenase / sirohydrochlorin ferrochelatase